MSRKLSRVSSLCCSVMGASIAAVVAAGAEGQNLSERLAHVAQQRQAALAHDTSKSGLLGALLYTDITVDFKATKAKDAIEYIANALGVPLVARYSSDRVGTGIDPEAEVTLKEEGKPALSILEMVLDQLGAEDACTWQIRDTFIEVGTKERLAAPAARELRMYAVRDLLFETPLFNNAPIFDLNSAIRQGNRGGGGSGGGGGGFGGGGGGGGFGGGGGGFGGGGGGTGGGGGGGGNVFGTPKEAPVGIPESERAEKLIQIITESVEPEAWTDAGGDWASIRYYQGVLIVRAPDFMHRALAGYPFAAHSAAPATVESRYVTFTAPVSIVENVKFRDVPVTGAAGGGGFGGGTGNPSPPQGGQGGGPSGGNSGGGKSK